MHAKTYCAATVYLNDNLEQMNRKIKDALDREEPKMESRRRALLLVGSPKGNQSTSQTLGTYLLGKLADGSFETQTAHIQTLMHSAEGSWRC